MPMRPILLFALFCHLLPALAQAPVIIPTDKEGRVTAPPPAPRGVYATINLAPMGELVKRLNTQGQRNTAAREVTRDAATAMPPVLYATASVLSGDRPEQAIFWYHVGRIRAVYDALRCRDASVRGFVTLMGQNLLSVELRRSQYYQRDHLVPVAREAVEWDLQNPRNYDQRWVCLYGKVAHSSPGADAAEVQVPESEWPEILKRVHDSHVKSVADFAAAPAPTR
jgi:hypothetical protein